jgi:hypothetical protein
MSTLDRGSSTVGEADHRRGPEYAYRRPREASGDLIKGAIQRLVDRAIESGDVRPNLDTFRSAAVSRRRLKRRVRTGLAAERKGDSSISSSSWVPARLSGGTLLTTNAATSERKVRPRVVILI